MPLIRIEKISADVCLGLWNITETTSVFFELYPHLLVHKPVTDTFKSEARCLEYLAVRALLSHMEGDDIRISHDGNGKPLLSNGAEISISHTRGYVAVIVSSVKRIAVDIEYVSERVGRVASKFLRDDENALSLHGQLLCWCAKETAYKLFSADNLGFHDIRISPCDLNGNTGVVKAENLKRNVEFDIYYNMTDKFMLTYAIYKAGNL